MQIGAQLYTIREFTKTPEDIASSFKKIAQIGYKTVQVSGIGAIDAHKLREIADENSLEIIITHTDPNRILDDTQKVINDHKIYGCKHIGIGSMPQKYDRNSIEGYREFISDYNEAAKMINANGMKLHYHNHGFEFAKLSGFIPYDLLLAETDSELWGFILDTFWVQYAGRNPVKQIEAMKGRIYVCHFKDMTMYEDTQHMAAVMEGNLDFTQIIKACKNTGIKYAMIEQDDCYGKSPFDELKVSFDNLQNKY